MSIGAASASTNGRCVSASIASLQSDARSAGPRVAGCSSHHSSVSWVMDGPHQVKGKGIKKGDYNEVSIWYIYGDNP